MIDLNWFTNVIVCQVIFIVAKLILGAVTSMSP